MFYFDLLVLCSKQKQAVWPLGSADTACPRPSVTLPFDRLTLKLVCESLLRYGTFNPNLGTLGLWVLELIAMYATDGQPGKQTDGHNKSGRLSQAPKLGHEVNPLEISPPRDYPLDG